MTDTHIVFVPFQYQEFQSSILKYPIIDEIPNILILVSTNNHSFNLMTTQFSGQFNHRSTILLAQLDEEGYDNWSVVNLYPDKLTNLHQRRIRLATFNYKPYTIVEIVVSTYI